MSDLVRIGLVGYGLGGRAFHAPLIACAPNAELVAVVTTSDERRAQLAQDHPGVPAVDGLRALVDAGAEAVAISSTTGTHTELADEAIALGVHVVVDKPLAVDAPAARRTVAFAERHGRLLTVYQNRRWDPDLLTVRRLLDEGALGDVFRFESRFERWAPGQPRAWWRAELPPEQGGGVRLDLMTHLTDQAVHLFGPVSSVYAEIATRRAASTADDDVTAVLHHRNGVSTHLAASTMTGDIDRRMRVMGTEGAYVIGFADPQETALRAGQTPDSLGNAWGVLDDGQHGRIVRGSESEPVVTERGRWDTFYPAFARAVRGEGPVPVDPHEAVYVLEILDAMAVSARENRVVAL